MHAIMHAIMMHAIMHVTMHHTSCTPHRRAHPSTTGCGAQGHQRHGPAHHLGRHPRRDPLCSCSLPWRAHEQPSRAHGWLQGWGAARTHRCCYCGGVTCLVALYVVLGFDLIAEYAGHAHVSQHCCSRIAPSARPLPPTRLPLSSPSSPASKRPLPSRRALGSC